MFLCGPKAWPLSKPNRVEGVVLRAVCTNPFCCLRMRVCWKPHPRAQVCAQYQTEQRVILYHCREMYDWSIDSLQQSTLLHGPRHRLPVTDNKNTKIQNKRTQTVKQAEVCSFNHFLPIKLVLFQRSRSGSATSSHFLCRSQINWLNFSPSHFLSPAFNIRRAVSPDSLPRFFLWLKYKIFFRQHFIFKRYTSQEYMEIYFIRAFVLSICQAVALRWAAGFRKRLNKSGRNVSIRSR